MALTIVQGGMISSTFSEFATGTAILFQQTAAPTGWTKSTSHDNKALRVVSGTASSGGSVAFTTAFSGTATVDGTAITTAQMPSHNHGISDPGHSHTVNQPGHLHPQTVKYTADYSHAHYSVGGGAAEAPTPTNGYGTGGDNTGYANSGDSINGSSTGISISNNGSGSAHSHATANFAVQYVDAIICTKN